MSFQKNKIEEKTNSSIQSTTEQIVNKNNYLNLAPKKRCQIGNIEFICVGEYDYPRGTKVKMMLNVKNNKRPSTMKNTYRISIYQRI